ncbi:hypothetical protein R3P38DRAFT_2812802 [Favolaschia claudopus]|uniref:Uncharacterized protein n=1 Tax=Favolaschia claudopus TaxID=2862362 RepID=A0AAV9Z5W0_9AGAR
MRFLGVGLASTSSGGFLVSKAKASALQISKVSAPVLERVPDEIIEPDWSLLDQQYSPENLPRDALEKRCRELERSTSEAESRCFTSDSVRPPPEVAQKSSYLILLYLQVTPSNTMGPFHINNIGINNFQRRRYFLKRDDRSLKLPSINLRLSATSRYSTQYFACSSLCCYDNGCQDTSLKEKAKKSDRTLMFPGGKGRHLTADEVIAQKVALEEAKEKEEVEKAAKKTRKEARKVEKVEIEEKCKQHERETRTKARLMYMDQSDRFTIKAA